LFTDVFIILKLKYTHIGVGLTEPSQT